MTKSLLISGSPRNGNTDFVLSRVAEGMKGEHELIFLRDHHIGFCKGCLACYSTGKCLQKDDMKSLFEKMVNADSLIIGSPLYYGNVSALMKNFIDRTIPAYESHSLKGKRLISIMVGGGKTGVTAQFHKASIKGFVKYNQLKLAARYDFEAFEINDLKHNPRSGAKINKIINRINER
jgi:multimeric flavodoxin WrbA